jgi:hypothetical protein
MQLILPAAGAELIQFQTARIITPILFRNVVPFFTFGARQNDVRANCFFSHSKTLLKREAQYVNIASASLSCCFA